MNPTAEQVADSIRNRIREYCEKKNLSLYAFACRAQISYSTLSDFMKKKTEPKLVTLVMIADYMKIPLSELVKVEE